VCVCVCVHSSFKEKNEFGEHHHLFRVLRRHPTNFFEYLRLSTDTFDYIHSKVHDSFESPHPWRGTEDEYSQTLANASGYKLVCCSFAAPLWTPCATHRRRLCVLTRLFLRIWITSGRPFRPSVSVVVPLVFLAFFPLQKHCNESWCIIFLQLLEHHAVWAEDLFDLSNSSDTPIHCTVPAMYFIPVATPRICEPAKSVGWLYSTGLLQTRYKRRLIFGPWFRSPQHITVVVHDDVVIISKETALT